MLGPKENSEPNSVQNSETNSDTSSDTNNDTNSDRKGEIASALLVKREMDKKGAKNLQK